MIMIGTTAGPERMQLTSRDEWQAELAQASGITDAPLSNIMPPLGITEMADFSLMLAFETLENLAASHADMGDEQATSIVSLFEGLGDSEKSGVLERTDPKALVLGHAAVQIFLGERTIENEQNELLSRWDDIAAETKDYVLSGISSGFIPKFVEYRLHDALHTTKVRLVDPALADNLGVGFYESEKDTIGFSANSLDGVDFIDTVLHEVIHKLSGGTFWRKGESNHARRRKVGFGYEVSDGSILRAGHNEAWDQHVTTGCKDGNFEIIDPDERNDDDGTYYAERKILAKFIDGAGGSIDVKNAIHAFFTDNVPGADNGPMRRYIEQGNTAYGRGWFRKMDHLMEVASWMPIDEVIKQIQSPTVDNNGIIVQQGSIDTDSLPSFDEYFTKIFQDMRANAVPFTLAQTRWR